MGDTIPRIVSRDYLVRPARVHDFFKLLSLEKSCFQADSWPWFDVLAALTFPETVRIVVEHGESIVAFVIGDRRKRKNVGWIASLGVHPDFRRQGLGGRLLAECEAALNTQRLRLSLRPSNLAALELYRTHGYIEVDRWRRYYRDGEDALVMEKTKRLE